MNLIMNFLDINRGIDYSDVHVRENEPIYIRIKGNLEKSKYIVDFEDISIFMKNIGYESILKNIRSNSDVDFVFSHNNQRFRTNIFMSQNSIGIVMRKIVKDIRSFEELGLPNQLKRLCYINSGLIVITGPTGSGKSSTLAAMIEYININMKKHIITVEDPIEYVFTNKKSLITQREIGIDSESFFTALKSSLRQDPDVIVIGEIRDRESLQIALRASETGHLCICTLHTLGAGATIERMLDLYDGEEKNIVRGQISMVLRAIISQQLVKCDRITPVIELLLMDKSSKSIIKEGKINQLQNHIFTNQSKGMISMDNSLIDMYNTKKLGYEDLMHYSIDDIYVKKRISPPIFLNGNY